MGVVADIGDGGAAAFDGTPLAVGDRVIPAPNRACGRCHMCRGGSRTTSAANLENYGNSMTAGIAPHLFGGWSEYLYLKPGTAVFRVPDELPDEVAVLTEIFAVTHSLERAAALPPARRFRPRRLVVIGAGALGLAHAVEGVTDGRRPGARARPLDRRRELGRARSPTPSTFLSPATKRRARCASAAVAKGRTSWSTRQISRRVSRKRRRWSATGGTIIEVGAFVDMGDEAFNPAVICGRNLTLMGVGGEDLRSYEGTLALLARHHRRIPLHEIVSHRFAIEDAPLAMATALDAEASAKVLIVPRS